MLIANLNKILTMILKTPIPEYSLLLIILGILGISFFPENLLILIRGILITKIN